MRMKLALLLSLLPAFAIAATPEEAARKAVASLAPQAKVDAVQRSEIPGFLEVMVGTQMVYVSVDGRFILDGSAFDARMGRDITEAAQARQRVLAMSRIGADQRIVFAPPDPKYTVTVFTDIDCPFCRRFHDQMARYNELGIAVEYVFLPLDIHPGADRKAEAVWCAADRKQAFTAAMAGADTGTATCTNPVTETSRIARSIGITGTPTALAADGTRLTPQIAMSPDLLVAELARIAQNPVATRP